MAAIPARLWISRALHCTLVRPDAARGARERPRVSDGDFRIHGVAIASSRESAANISALLICALSNLDGYRMVMISGKSAKINFNTYHGGKQVVKVRTAPY